MSAFSINLQGLDNKVHVFDFDIDPTFFRQRSEIVSTGRLTAQVELDKHETFMAAEFRIQGEVTLTCDRSLDAFEYPLKTRRTLMFKFGARNEELTDDVIVLERELPQLDLGQYIYEFIILGLPMKKLHPRYAQEELENEGTTSEFSEGRIVFTSGTPEEDSGEADPRWDALKKLNNL